MMILKVAFVVVIGAIVVILLMKNRGKWARSLQKYYIAQSNGLSGFSGGWDEPWRLSLFKALVIFFGLMAVLGVYVLVFSQR
jgi:hypothetical protein